MIRVTQIKTVNQLKGEGNRDNMIRYKLQGIDDNVQMIRYQ